METEGILKKATPLFLIFLTLMLSCTIINQNIFQIFQNVQAQTFSINDWTTPQQITFATPDRGNNPLLIKIDNSLKLFWTENHKLFSATYNGAFWQDKEALPQIAINSATKPFLVTYDGVLYSVSYDTSVVALQEMDGISGTVGQWLKGVRAFDYSAVNYENELYFFYLSSDNDSGFAQIWFTKYDGQQWSNPKQITFPPRYAYNIQAGVANGKLVLTYASYVPDKTGFVPAVYSITFNRDNWSPATKLSEGCPISITSEDNKLLLIYSTFGYDDTPNEPIKLRIYSDDWSPDTFPLPSGQSQYASGESIITSSDNAMVLAWTVNPLVTPTTISPENPSLWFSTNSKADSISSSDAVTFVNGLAQIDKSATTGVQLSITSSSIPDDTAIKIETIKYDNSQINIGNIQAGSLALYDVRVISTTDLPTDVNAVISLIDEAFSSDCSVSYWDGQNWISVSTTFISPNTLQSRIPVSALTGTPLIVKPSIQETGVDSYSVILIIILILAIVTILALIMIGKKNKKPNDALRNKQ
jgi:hypothetical protein